MSSSTTAFTTNHLRMEKHPQHMPVENIYRKLTNVFANDTFKAFTQTCKQTALYLDNYPKSNYSPKKFDSTKHKVSSTTTKDYLDFLTNEDPNADLKFLKPVEIVNDGSVLFRAVASLLGFSSEENVRELRLRCLVDAISNLKSYVNNYEELESLLFPDEITIRQWSNFVHEKERMDEPNIITMLILIALAKVINIPIRSVYSPASTQELNENPDHMYNLLNRVFYPSHNQHHDTEIEVKPIVILWWYTQIKDVTYPDIVIPLFEDDPHDATPSTCLTPSGISDIFRPSTMNHNASVARYRGTYILISKIVSDSSAYPKHQRINDLKMAIVDLMKKIASNARPGDIVEVNTCDKELTQPPLLPFCEATTVDTKKNADLINAIKFREGAHSNLSHCISAAQDKLARQSIYHIDFFMFVDNLTNYTDKTSVEKSVLRVIRGSQSINSQIFVSSEDSIDSNELLQTAGDNYLDNAHIDGRNHCSNNGIRQQKIIFYKRNDSSQDVEKPKTSIGPASDNTHSPVLMKTNVRFVKVPDSTSEASTQHENNGFLSKMSIYLRQKVPTEGKKEGVSSQQSYPVPTLTPSIKFKVGFS